MNLYNEEGWADNTAMFSSAQGNGTTEPNWENIGNGMYAYRFTNGEEIFTYYHINHDIKPGGKTYPHIHWMPKVDMVAGEDITWELTISIAKGHHQGEVLNGSTVQMNLLYTADGTELAGEHMILECSDTQYIITPEVDSIIMMRCKYYDGSYGEAVHGLMADLHYEVDRNSTPNKAPDFYN